MSNIKSLKDKFEAKPTTSTPPATRPSPSASHSTRSGSAPKAPTTVQPPSEKKDTNKNNTNTSSPSQPAKPPPAKPPPALVTQPPPLREPIDNTVLGTEAVHINVTTRRAPGSENEEEHIALISLQTPAGSSRTPVDVCCVIDNSYQMGYLAQMRNVGGELESHGFTVFDLVKHAVKTVSCSLAPQDRLSVVIYSTEAQEVVWLTYMDDAGKKEVDNKISTLAAANRDNYSSQTNIWAGFERGLEILRFGAQPGRVASLFLLTGSLSAGGEVPNFKMYMDKHKLPCFVSTFGFGYDLNSTLLKEIALEGHGMYSYICDSSVVGTAFINAISNLLVTMGTHVSVSLKALNGSKIVSVLGGKFIPSPGAARVELSSLQYGQSQDLVMKINIPNSLLPNTPFVGVTLNFDHWNFTQPVAISVEAADHSSADGTEIQVHRCRLAVAGSITRMITLRVTPRDVANLLKTLQQDIEQCNDARAQALLQDVTGQITIAITNDEYFNKWGGHYLPSLSRSHMLQQCSNFKDPGMQHYGGTLFRKIRDEVDAIFCSLPPPIPSPSTTPFFQPFRPIDISSFDMASFDMSSFNSAGRPCFDESCFVLMRDGTQKRVKDITKGDRVYTSMGCDAEIICVLKTRCEGYAELVELQGGLLITPYHPIQVNNKWCFPCDLKQPTVRRCSAVYSFVLPENSSHTMVINSVVCITLGHNYTDNDVVRHPYFGTRKVVDDLEGMKGWSEGFIEIQPRCVVRDKTTGLICKIQQFSGEGATVCVSE